MITKKNIEAILFDPEISRLFSAVKHAYPNRYKSATCSRHYKQKIKLLRQKINNGPSFKAKIGQIR